MDLQAMSLTVIAGGILLAHLATLRLLMECKVHLSGASSELNGATSDFDQKLSELVNIGSDVADALDGVLSGVGSTPARSASVADEPFDLKATVLSLITDRLMAGIDGSKTQSERAIQQENDTTTPSESVLDSETVTP
jgi:hypothetical protein